MYKKFHLKISWKYNSLQILKSVWVLSSIFFWATRIESVFSSLWMVKFITSPPSCYCNLPSVFFLTCWGLTKILVLSKAWHLGTMWGETWNFYCFSSVFLSPGPPFSLPLHQWGPCSHTLSATRPMLSVWQWQQPSWLWFIFTSCQLTLGSMSVLGE